MKIRVGYKLWGTIEVDVPDEAYLKAVQKGRPGIPYGHPLAEETEKAILEVNAHDLIQGVEGMPLDIEGDAIEVISIESLNSDDVWYYQENERAYMKL